MSEYGRFFTSTRHIPMTFGTNPATGERLPGGPYTSVQAFGGIGVGLLLWLTNSLWGTGRVIADLVIGAGLTALTVWLLRFMPDDLTELWTLGIGATKILDSPSGGTYEGKPLKTSRPPKAPAGLVVPTLADTVAVEEIPAEHELDDSQPRRHLGTSSVDRLLAHTSEETPR